MPLTLHEITVLPFLTSLTSLSSILDKAESHISSDSISISESTLLSARLAPDMHPLSFQIQRLCDMASCLSTCFPPLQTHPTIQPTIPPTTKPILPSQPNPSSLPGLQNLVTATVTMLNTLDEKNINSKENNEIKMPIPGGERKWDTGRNFVVEFLIPNFYFHYCMVYALLRREGVPLGKRDYLGGK